MKTLTTSLFFIFFLCLHPFIGKTQTSTADSLALVALYDATGGPSWTNSWILTNPVHIWHGVTTTNYRVTHLSLPNNQLSGGIPPEIGNLSKLIHLYLNKNNLVGAIPSSIGNLTDLEQLSLKDNDLDGIIPSSIGTLTNLNQLILQKNLLSGPIPISIGDLTNLTHLYLSQNTLSGTIPTTIGNLSNMTNLSLSQNQLEGNIPVEMEDLSSLKYCYLNVNQLDGTIPSGLGDLSSLIQLSLNKNELEGAIPAELGDLNNLKFLHLQDNNLSGNIPSELGDMSSLQQLYLQNNELAGKIPVELGDLSSLTHLSLAVNQLTDTIAKELGDLSNLTSLYLNKNQLKGRIPANLGNLSNLKYMSLSDNKLSGTIPSDLGNLSSVIHLLLSNNKLSGTIPSQLGSISSLTHLYLHYNRLKGDVPDLSNTNILYVHFNRFLHEDIALNHSSNSSIGTYTFSPQNYGYEQHVSNPLTSAVELKPSPSIPYDDPSVRWRKDGSYITSSYDLHDSIYNIASLAVSDIGVYEYWFIDYTLSPTVEFRSLALNNYVDSLDLEGDSIIADQLIIDLTNVPADSIYIALAQLDSLGGTAIDSCGCDKKLYLYEFDDVSIYSVLDTLAEGEDSDEDTGFDGGFNKKQNSLESPIGENKYLPEFYAAGTFEDTVVVAYLDTGIDITHPGVSTRLWVNPEINDADNCYMGDYESHGYNFVDKNGDVTDIHGHGTSVGGLIAENIPDDAHIQVMPVKIYGNKAGTLFNLGCGIHYAIDNNADLVNISIGYNGQKSSMLENAFLRAKKEGIIACVSAGNDGISIDHTNYWPAGFANSDKFDLPNVLTIAALDQFDQFWEHSNYGPNTVSFAVKGEGLVTPTIGGYGDLTGTSASAPLATLALAINMSVEKDRTYNSILDELDGQLDSDIIFDPLVKGGKYLDIQLSEDYIYLDLTLLMEGALPSSTATTMNTTLNDLNLLPFDSDGDIEHPYAITSDDWTGVTEYDPDVVDWVLVALREDPDDMYTTFYETPALLLKDGSIWFNDPIRSEDIDFSTITSFYIVIKHRNHLPVATPDPITVEANIEYDFTAEDSYSTSTTFGQKEITTDVWVMYGGNVLTSYPNAEEISGLDLTEWDDDYTGGGGSLIYWNTDSNLDGYIDASDGTMITGNNGVFSAITIE